MRLTSFSKLVATACFLVLALPLFAQETGLTGIITDPQGAVIANAKVEIKRTDGSSFFATTNSQGAYVVPSLSAAEYTITVSAPGFAKVQKKLLLLVGQLAQIDVTIPVAADSTTTIVEATDQLAIDTTSSVVAGNVTPVEVQDTPINGRNYLSLSTLVPGIKANAFGDAPVSGGDAETGKFQVTMDGLQVDQDSVGSSFGQPRFSQDAISQFQIITNRFDATAGRSAGLYVNTQSKSGTNLIHGGAFAYVRNSFSSAGDPVTRNPADGVSKYVIPFSDQQYGGTFGGAVKKDKIWYFTSYEGERRPDTYSSKPTLSTVSGTQFTHPTELLINEYLGRVDYQLNEKNHIFVRGDGFTYSSSYDGSNDPSGASTDSRSSYGYVADWNRSITDHLTNDLHAGFHNFKTTFLPVYTTPVFTLPSPSGGSVTIGSPYNRPETFTQPTQQYRDDIFWLLGKHSLKMGGEFLYLHNGGHFEQNVRGSITCTAFVAADVAPYTTAYAAIFPKGTTDSSTWNYAAIQQNCTSVTFVQGFGNYDIDIPRKIAGIWADDDWKVIPRLTLNLGVRYDNDIGAFLNNLKITNGLLTPNTNPNLNFAPRLGFSYDPFGNGNTSIRGGAGLYYADINQNPTIDDQLFNGQTAVQATLTNPANLASPFAGQTPLSNPAAYVQTPQYIAQGAKTPYSVEASFGIARKLPFKTTLTADLTHQRVYRDYILLDGNLLVNPANPQQNLNPATALTAAVYAQRVCGNGAVTLDTLNTAALSTAGPGGTSAKQVCNQSFAASSTGTGNRQFTLTPGAGMIADALAVGIKHAATHGVSGALAYTWGRSKSSTSGAFSYPNKPFIAGIQQEWSNGTDDQRHTLTVNGQYDWKYGLMLSSLFHFGSGTAYATTSGTTGVNGYTAGTRTFAAGTTPIAPGATCPQTPCVTIYAPISKVHYDAAYGYWIVQRNALRGTPYERLDSRLQESFKIHDRYRAIIAVESFNILNHANYASFGGSVVSNTLTGGYGVPTAAGSSAIEYAARSFQFIGRLSF